MRKLDLTTAARTMSRLDFVVAFVAQAAARRADRSIVNGMQVKRAGKGWVYGFADGPALSAPMDSSRIYDAIRRTALNYYVRQAEELREDAITR